MVTFVTKMFNPNILPSIFFNLKYTSRCTSGIQSASDIHSRDELRKKNLPIYRDGHRLCGHFIDFKLNNPNLIY